MMGAIKAAKVFQVAAGTSTLSLTGATAAQLAGGASLLVSFVNGANEVQAFDVPLKATSADGTVGGTVPATLALTLGAPASFGAFTPGITKEYTATTEATVTSTAGDATLSVGDPGHLTNGAFSLPEPLRVELSKTSWTGPVSNDKVGVLFKQLVKDKDPLRTGSYSKTVTFTLSTTQP
jgi:hypothetical protein